MTGTVELYVINVDGTGLTQLADEGTENISSRWPPDGRRIVFSNLFAPDFGFHRLVTMNVDGSDRRQSTNQLLDDYQSEYTTDGRRIIFSSSVGGLSRCSGSRTLTDPERLSDPNRLLYVNEKQRKRPDACV
jgi:TolB protein